MSQKAEWKQKVRDKFREEIQKWLEIDYDFYAMQAHPDVDGVAYIREHFKELLGKVYTPFENENVYSLALDNAPEHREYNAELVKTLSQFFYVDHCALGAMPEDALAAIKAEGFVPAIENNGVLMVMMENYKAKSAFFLSHGHLAVGIKLTKDAMEIIEHIHNLGYVLFHYRSIEGQHLFPILGECKVLNSSEIDDDVYKVTKDKEIYIIFDIDVNAEMDDSLLDCRKRSCVRTTRYDAQYAEWNDLKV